MSFLQSLSTVELSSRIKQLSISSVIFDSIKQGYDRYGSNFVLYITTLLVSLLLTCAKPNTLKSVFPDAWEYLQLHMIWIFPAVLFALSISVAYFGSRSQPIYLLDFSCYKPDDNFKVSREEFLYYSQQSEKFNAASMAFQRKILERSGLGDETYGPAALLKVPPNPCLAESRKETSMMMFGALDELFEKTGVKPKDIGTLVVNSSVFCPTPSLSAIVVNRYKMRSNIRSFNLGGMGCSAGIIAIDLAKDMLQAHPNSYALVVSTENITYNWYIGNNRAMLVTNCLFRMGCAAILLSNIRRHRKIAKYKLQHVVRTHVGADDKSYRCAIQDEDEERIKGVALSKDLMKVAAVALRTNITTLGPLVLPLSEQIRYLATFIANKVLRMKTVKVYIPDFKLAFEHFCIHAGGRGVLDEIESNLMLTPWHMEPSRMTLYRFGNTSSSSLWYELAYSEAKTRIRKGDRIWQIAVGSGFKCNSAVWKALRTVKYSEKSPWVDCILKFPALM
ncbi:hypothetical protein O6H91_12G081500 [Diphasiastrum complanatum]|uniref:Uncharacterized protein n=1 Tax=Diphasiastrum complanatum TaxID=34168 RepID=A0ACC2C423_DIPCM|nr:hypothetical protein O6H91_Y240100 [Diphasiastrum complanatum]KAJ7536772.1 hypothetical protein O6H91_12G081500 [Diphasiastrum complanatum]